ncbi:hypothetical protein STVA_01330 [Allostella vacuolata]|nr:hypothetical protein STVA_01330 [Stella vacuolata]
MRPAEAEAGGRRGAGAGAATRGGGAATAGGAGVGGVAVRPHAAASLGLAWPAERARREAAGSRGCRDSGRGRARGGSLRGRRAAVAGRAQRQPLAVAASAAGRIAHLVERAQVDMNLAGGQCRGD